MDSGPAIFILRDGLAKGADHLVRKAPCAANQEKLAARAAKNDLRVTGAIGRAVGWRFNQREALCANGILREWVGKQEAPSQVE